MRPDALSRLRDDPIDWRCKGFPPANGITPENVRAQTWNVLGATADAGHGAQVF